MAKKYKKSQTPKSNSKKQKVARKRTRRDAHSEDEDLQTHSGGAPAPEPNSVQEQDLLQSRASSPDSGQQDTVNSARSRASSPTSCQQDDFSDESKQEQSEPGVNVNELETSVVASDYKEQGQLIKPSPAAIKNTAQSSPTTLKNKAECKVQIAEAVSHGGRSDDESESSTGSPATSASAVQSASNGAERNIEVILIDCYKVVLRDEELS
jgi:hypothetical protein